MNNRLAQPSGTTSIERMLFYLTITETLISLYWLCNGVFFFEVKQIKDHCDFCFVSSLISIFIQTFEFSFFMCSLHNIRCFVKDPLKERNFNKRLKWYFFISIGSSLLFTYSVFFTGIYGLSV